MADDLLSLSVISKSINTSYINLKRHNPLQLLAAKVGALGDPEKLLKGSER